MPRQAEPRQSDKQLSRRIAVLVDRDPMLKTPRAIWQHEFPILEEIFGEDKVTEIDAKVLDDGYVATVNPSMLAYNKTQDAIDRPSANLGIGHVFTGNPEVEYQRLAEVYGRHPEENILLVEKVYGRSREGRFQRMLGMPDLADLPEKQLRSLIVDYGYAPEPHKDASQDEKNAAFAKRKELAAMSMDGLIKIAQEVGVQIG